MLYTGVGVHVNHSLSKTDQIWTELSELATHTQVLNYWEKRQSRILDSLVHSEADSEKAIDVILRLARALNETEKHAAVFYLYKSGYLPIENKLNQSEQLNEAKYELGRGLHHNRKYDHAKKLFNELGKSNFDTRRIEPWWNQSAFASVRDKVWIKTDVLPTLAKLLLTLLYFIIAVTTDEFLLTTAVFILIMELFEAWSYQNKVSYYLKDFENSNKVSLVRSSLKKKLIIEFVASLLFYILYLTNEQWAQYLAITLGVYMQAFHFALNRNYLSKLVGEMNRDNTTRQQRI